VHARLGDRALRVVDDEPRRNRGEPFEGAAMTAEPGRHRLIPDELDVLMPREAQRHHEAPRTPLLAASGVDQERPGAEVDLRRFTGCELQPHGGFGRPRRAERLQHSPYCRVAAAVAVLAAQRGMDRDASDALLDPPRNERAKRLDRRHGAARTPCAADQCRNLAVRRQPRVGDEPVVLDRQCPQDGHLRAAHQASARDVAVGIALAQAHQDRSILEHLDSPARHLAPPRKNRGA